MAGTVVRKDSHPALAMRNALPTPADLEGWDSDDVRAGFQVVSGSFRERRLAVGLLLWKFRSLNVDAVYREESEKQAEICDVDVRTLERWRVFAERHWNLPPPSRRSVSKRGAGVNDDVSLNGEDDPPPPPQDAGTPKCEANVKLGMTDPRILTILLTPPAEL